MMTIRHIGDDRKERILSVVSVNYDPDKNEIVALQSIPGKDGVGANALQFDSGVLYVMNEGGQTVASYNLRPKKKQ